ncbi:MAG: hypothetical protein Q4D19_01700 [Lautropia sp.]|nr:hypothetical protein [Lautropia sp.]
MPVSENRNDQPGDDPFVANEADADDDDESLPRRTAWARALWVLIAVVGAISALGTLIIVVQIARLWWAL